MKSKVETENRDRKGKMADSQWNPPLATTRGSNTHFSDLLRALWAPHPHRPSAIVIWPILLKEELIERIDLLWVGRHSPNNYLM